MTSGKSNGGKACTSHAFLTELTGGLAKHLHICSSVTIALVPLTFSQAKALHEILQFISLGKFWSLFSYGFFSWLVSWLGFLLFFLWWVWLGFFFKQRNSFHCHKSQITEIFLTDLSAHFWDETKHGKLSL